MQYTKRLTTLVLAVLLAVSLFLFPSCKEPEPPVIETKQLTWPVSVPLPTAEQFVTSVPEGCSVKLADKYNFVALGAYPISLIVTDEKGREFSYTASLTLVEDTTPPTINGLRDLLVYLGGTVSYMKGVSTEDNCDAGVTLTVNTENVNLKALGIYDVIYPPMRQEILPSFVVHSRFASKKLPKKCSMTFSIPFCQASFATV